MKKNVADCTELPGEEPAAPPVRRRIAHEPMDERSVSGRVSTRRNCDPRAGGATDQAEVAADIGSTAGSSRREHGPIGGQSRERRVGEQLRRMRR